jgi:hypothetical protein
MTKRSQLRTSLPMTSLRRIEANRRNALKSTGPTTDAGKRRARRNATRHGLTAEAVIDVLEDSKQYRAFEMLVTAEFDAQTAVERELVLRLANLFWRLRRAIAIETGLLQIQSDVIRDPNRQQLAPMQVSEQGCDAGFRFIGSMSITLQPDGPWNGQRHSDASSAQSNNPRNDSSYGAEMPQTATAFIARCFLRLANLDNGASDRLSRYESALWRQASQILFMLKLMRRQTRSEVWQPKPRGFSDR